MEDGSLVGKKKCVNVKVFKSGWQTTLSNSSRFSWSPRLSSVCVSRSSRPSTQPICIYSLFVFFVCQTFAVVLCFRCCLAVSSLFIKATNV